MLSTRQGLAYAPYFCEENIWHLSRHPDLAKAEKHVVFISNTTRSCALWRQRAAPDDKTPVIWDYHVILYAGDGQETWVFDLDTTVSFPMELSAYLEITFPFGSYVSELYAPRFRVIDDQEHRCRFSSDRSHMRAEETEDWLQPPPPWAPIQIEGEKSNLDRFIEMDRAWVGEVYDLAGLCDAFGVEPGFRNRP